MFRRTFIVLFSAVLVAVSLSACAPTPTPVPDRDCPSLNSVAPVGTPIDSSDFSVPPSVTAVEVRGNEKYGEYAVVTISVQRADWPLLAKQVCLEEDDAPVSFSVSREVATDMVDLERVSDTFIRARESRGQTEPFDIETAEVYFDLVVN